MESGTYRLPSEAEWEYAAGGGQHRRTIWAGTNEKGELNSYAVMGNINEVGLKQPNRLMLYDMTGNVLEWCQDNGRRNYKKSPHNGIAYEAGLGNFRVIRGGTLFSSVSGTTIKMSGVESDKESQIFHFPAHSNFREITFRCIKPPIRRHQFLGFRVAKTL